ncbi:akirin-like [Ctenocephalides felis]|uniref:akirin-like n=1 Tax=Ctenocephalides felis TaxID=7515 RepID=UPI000E6E28B6|nr:akirin-like [Ctenocephalides felis]XP_026472489.1 akirin-like [Ctenocephalides felis]
MACATLKRSSDWESPLNQRPPKRRRCNPYGTPPPSSHNANMKVVEPKPSPFGEIDSKLTPEKMAANIREEIRRLHKRKQLNFNHSQMNSELEHHEDSAGSSSGSESCMMNMSPVPSPESQNSEIGIQNNDLNMRPNYGKNPDKALFTFKQVGMICEKMLREREIELREQYDRVLTAKLAEQYDAFVKFTYDQIQRRYEATPSYLS